MVPWGWPWRRGGGACRMSQPVFLGLLPGDVPAMGTGGLLQTSRRHPACCQVAAARPVEAGMKRCGGTSLFTLIVVVIIVTRHRSLLIYF